MFEVKVKDVYERRFNNSIEFRNQMWKVLCSNFFQKFVPEEATVLEIAAGYCEFINNINARQKIAVDINEDTQKRANKDVKVLLTKSSDLSLIDSESIDIIFISNFFEHITKEEITKTVIECYRCLKLGGKLLVLQPNIRYIYKNYWMFYDHITPIDDRALRELLEIIGFKINLLLPKFLPYTTKSRFPKSLFLIKLYLKLPLLYKLFGGQAFVIAQK
jgi:ubiquinone/menaquinone biosynthesis C-methylase UbiE